MKKTRTAALVGTAFLGSALAFSAFADGHTHDHDHSEHKHEHHDHDEHEHHGKHEHGVADLDIALDGKQLLVQLTSPAANFLGFEHQPSTEEQKKAYAKMVKLLNKPKKIIDVEGGKCKLSEKDIDLPYEVAEHKHHHDHDHDEHAHHEHAHHEHDEHKEHEHHEHDEHKHEEHAHHDHEKEHDHDHGSKHSDIEFKYVYTCNKAERLEHVDVKLFDRFNGFEKINVQWIANNKQGHATLTSKETEVELHEH